MDIGEQLFCVIKLSNDEVQEFKRFADTVEYEPEDYPLVHRFFDEISVE